MEKQINNSINQASDLFFHGDVQDIQTFVQKNGITILTQVAIKILQNIEIENSTANDKRERCDAVIEKLKCAIESKQNYLEECYQGSVNSETITHFPCIEQVRKVINYHWLDKSFAPPDLGAQLLNQCPIKSSITSSELTEAADLLNQWSQVNNSSENDESILTTVLLLYEKAAQKCIQSNDIEGAFKIRNIAATSVNFSNTHPLHNIDEAISEQTNKNSNPSHGAYFNHLDSGNLKTGNLHAAVRNIDGIKMNYFDFKLSHHLRVNFNETINAIKEHLKEFKKTIPSDLCPDFKFKEVDYIFKGKNENGIFSDDQGLNPQNAKALRFEFEGIGNVIVGADPDYGCLYNNVTVEMKESLPPGEGLKKLNQMLTLLGFGPIIGVQRADDNERMKIAQIFRIFHPAEAAKMERTIEFYEYSIADLMNKILEEVPSMTDHFQNYLEDQPDLLVEEEIYPGKTIWTINDFSNKMREQGAYGLMMGVGETSINKAAETLTYILKDGALSTQDRMQAGLFGSGASPERDLALGGGDQVFTRLITDKIADSISIQEYPYHGKLQLLIDLNALNRGGYGYEYDRYGIKNSAIPDEFEAYANRESLLDLPRHLNRDTYGNEVMVKNRIAPHLIRGVMVQSEKDKIAIIDVLTEKGLIENEEIMGIPINEFIHVSKMFSEEMWA